MKLTLHPATRAAGPVAAAFLGGADPAAWLRELSRWGLDAEEVRGYVVPQSISTSEPLGLLVVFGSRVPEVEEIAAPYTCVAGTLFMPCHATLTPACTDAELAQRLLYPVQVFHPAAGLVGFDHADALSFAPLLHCAPPAENNWNEALAPAPEFPPLQSVGMPRANAENFMQQVQQEIGAKPLRQIMSDEERRRNADGLQSLQLSVLGLFNRLLGGKNKAHNSGAAVFVKLFTFLGWTYLALLSVIGLIANRPGWREAFVWMIAALGAMLVLGMVSSMEEKGKGWKRLSTGLVFLFLFAAVAQIIHLIIQIAAYQNPSALILLMLGAAVVLLYVLYRKVVNRKESSLFSLTYLHSLNAVTIWFTSLVLLIMLTQVFMYGIVLSETWFLFGVSVAVMLLYPKLAGKFQSVKQERSAASQSAASQPDSGSSSFPWGLALLWAGGIALVFMLVFNVISLGTLFKLALWVGGIFLVLHLIGRLRRNMRANASHHQPAASYSYSSDSGAEAGRVILIALVVVGALLFLIFLLAKSKSTLGFSPILIIVISFLLRMLMDGIIGTSVSRSASPHAPRRTVWARLADWWRRNRGTASGVQAASVKRSWFGRWRHRVRERVQRSMEDLQRRRESELDRLVRMMDENPDEGLQYAVPLNSEYMGRGGDNGWDSLARGLPDFSLGGLGGGGGGGSFTSPEHYQKLRERYMKQANLLLEKGDYRKAAYVYAHLLGDLHSAASVLEQGRYYREAAALYKDHLKNQLLAAQCLEKGGLLAEAAEEYREIRQHEKAGDLYRMLAHEEKAQSMYQLCVEQALAQQNYLEAARLQHDKQHHTAAAEETLLLGWNSMHPQENCLHRYIALRAAQEESSAHTAQRLYAAGLKMQQEQIFLNQLRLIYQHAAPNSTDAALAQQLALRLISTQAMGGKHAALNLLQHFAPDDRLVQADASRYIVQNRVHTPPPAALPELQGIDLPKGVAWRKLLTGSRYWVALGETQQKLSMVRISATGQTEQFNWTDPFTEAENLEIQHHPLLPDVIQLRNRYTTQVLCNGYMAATSLHPAALAAVFFDYLPERLLAYSAGENENSCWVLLYHPQLSLQYWEQGKLIKQLDLHFEHAPPEALAEGNQFASYGYYANGFFYCNYLNYHLNINTTNALTAFTELPEAAYNLQLSAYHSNPVFSMASYHDIFVVQPGTQKVWRKILGEFVSEMTFISYKHIAYYREGQLVVCELADNGEMPVVYRRPVGDGLVSLTAAGRNKIAWLDTGGIVQVLEVPLGL